MTETPEDRLVMALSRDEVDLLRMGLVRYVLHWQRHHEEDGGETHTPEELERVTVEAGRLLWRLEQETAPPDVTIVPSEFAVSPGPATEPVPFSNNMAAATHEPPLHGDSVTLGPDTMISSSDNDHCFMVFRLLPEGRWVGSWSEGTKTTIDFRGQCTCGWEGPSIAGNGEAGREDDLDRERVYDYWMQHHYRVVARPYVHPLVR